MKHPLFPHAEDSDKREIAWINVTRFEAGGHIWHPRAFPADELTSLEDITTMFGGGTYELIGRVASSQTGGIGPICDRVKLKLAGEPKSFSGEPTAATAATPADVPRPAVAPGTSDMGMFLNLLMHQQSESTKLMVGMMTAQSQQTASIVAAFAGGNKGGDTSAIIAAMAEMSKSHTESMARLMSERSAASSAAEGGGVETLIKGMELGQAQAEGMANLLAAAESAKEDSDMKTIVEGIKAAAELKGSSKRDAH